MIIGFSGKMGSGKDTVASMLSYILFRMKAGRTSYYDYTTVSNREEMPYIIPFAKSLKKISSILIGCDEENLYDQDYKKRQISWLAGSPTVRKILQDVGTIFREKIDPDVWVKILLHQSEYLDHVLVPDVRFPNEAKMIKEKGGIVIRINRPGCNGDEHISETALDDYTDFDFVIENNGTLGDLWYKVLDISNEIYDKYTNY